MRTLFWYSNDNNITYPSYYRSFSKHRLYWYLPYLQLFTNIWSYLSASSRISISTLFKLKLGALCKWSMSLPGVAITTSGPSLRAASWVLISRPPVRYNRSLRVDFNCLVEQLLLSEQRRGHISRRFTHAASVLLQYILLETKCSCWW